MPRKYTPQLLKYTPWVPMHPAIKPRKYTPQLLKYTPWDPMHPAIKPRKYTPPNEFNSPR